MLRDLQHEDKEGGVLLRYAGRVERLVPEVLWRFARCFAGHWAEGGGEGECARAAKNYLLADDNLAAYKRPGGVLLLAMTLIATR